MKFITKIFKVIIFNNLFNGLDGLSNDDSKGQNRIIYW